MSRKQLALILVLMLVLLLALAACAGAEAPSDTASEQAPSAAPEIQATQVEEYAEPAQEVEVIEEVIVEGETVEEEEPAEEPAAEDIEEPVEAVGSEDDDGSPFEPSGGPKVKETRVAGDGWVDETVVEASGIVRSGQQFTATPAAAATVRMGEGVLATLEPSAQLTAAEVDDNMAWEAYLSYLVNFASEGVIPVDVSERQVIVVIDQNERPLSGAMVEITAAADAPPLVLRTHSDGRVYFFPNAYEETAAATEYTVVASHSSAESSFTFSRAVALPEWTVKLDIPTQVSEQAALDVLFLLDATGSMGDEIAQLTSNIEFIATQIEALPARPDVRFGMTVYRDRGEAFTSRTFDFTADVGQFAAALAEVEAQGGGDYPEDLTEGLFKALSVPTWRLEETISLIFLVGDAPPHIDYVDQQTDYIYEMKNAAAQGIKIYPIASSGLDADGEYVFRQLAQFTGGKFLFLTYGAAGAGATGEETDLSVGETKAYDVTSLDGLVIKIVAEELAHRLRQ